MPSAHSPSVGMLVGVLSDTHGRLSDAVVRSLSGVDHVIHAGDIGSPQIIARLTAIAPLTAVRGNCDRDVALADLPRVADVDLAGTGVVVCHRLEELLGIRDPISDGTGLVVFGHTHVPSVEIRSGVVFLNPGSASAGRGGTGRSMAVVSLDPGGPEVRFVGL